MKHLKHLQHEMIINMIKPSRCSLEENVLEALLFIVILLFYTFILININRMTQSNHELFIVGLFFFRFIVIKMNRASIKPWAYVKNALLVLCLWTATTTPSCSTRNFIHRKGYHRPSGLWIRMWKGRES